MQSTPQGTIMKDGLAVQEKADRLKIIFDHSLAILREGRRNLTDGGIRSGHFASRLVALFQDRHHGIGKHDRRFDRLPVG